MTSSEFRRSYVAGVQDVHGVANGSSWTYQHDAELDEKRPLSLHGPLKSASSRSIQNSITPKLQYDHSECISLNQKTNNPDQKNSESIVTDPEDPNVIGWDGPDDIRKGLNWAKKTKWLNMSIISAVTFLTPLASSAVAPAIPLIMREFDFTSQTIGSFVVSIYILGYAVGPLFLAPLSEMYGRLPVYHACNFAFVLWSLACALAPNIGSLLAFRLFAGIAGSCPLTIGGGSVADLFIQEERGAAMAIFAMGPILAPTIGPVAGAYLSQDAGWRWLFWLLTIAGGVCLVFSLVIMRETYEPILLERRVKQLRTETGNVDLKSKLASGLPRREMFLRAIVRPSKMLIYSPIVLILSVYTAIVYGYVYLLFTTLTAVFELEYHFGQGAVGLTFLGIGVGAILGIVLFGGISDRLVKHMSRKGEMKPEYRLPPLIPGSLFVPLGLFWYGWTAEKHLHWILPILGTMWVGLGMLAAFMPIQTYLVDAFTTHAASAIAANTVLRCLMGAFLPLAGPRMYEALGLGWGNSLLAFVALAMAPISWFIFKYGERIRKSARFQVQF